MKRLQKLLSAIAFLVMPAAGMGYLQAAPVIKADTVFKFTADIYHNIDRSVFKDYIIKNDGDADLTISSFSSTERIDVQGLPITIPAGETDTIKVGFNAFAMYGPNEYKFDVDSVGGFTLTTDDPAKPSFSVKVGTGNIWPTNGVSELIRESFNSSSWNQNGWQNNQLYHQAINGIDNTGCLRASLSQYNTNAFSITPYVKMGANPIVSFSYKAINNDDVTPSDNNSIKYFIIVSQYGKSTDDTVYEGTHTASTDYTRINYNLSDYANEYCRVKISFRFLLTSNIYIYFDDFTVGTLPVKDLIAKSIKGYLEPTANAAANYTVAVTNLGTETQETYTVKLIRKGTATEVDSKSGISIAQNETKEFTLSYTPATAGEDTLYATVELTGDEYPTNNTTAILPLFVISDIAVWTESFENNNTSIPAGWTQERISGTVDWIATVATTTNSKENPKTVHGGSYKVGFYAAAYGTPVGSESMLITAPINLTGVTLPVLKFWRTQNGTPTLLTVLSVYYKTSFEEEWTLLHTYTNTVANWTEEQIVLPNPSATYYIGFSGRYQNGDGVQLDNLSIEPAPAKPVIGVVGGGSPLLAFGAIHSNIDKNVTQKYIIKNNGAAELTISSVTPGNAAITIADFPANIAGGEQDTITVNLNANGLANTTFNSNFVVNSNDEVTPALTVSVTASVSAAAGLTSLIREPFATGYAFPTGWSYSGFDKQNASGGVDNTPCVRATLNTTVSKYVQTSYVNMGTNPMFSFKYKVMNYSGANLTTPTDAAEFKYYITVSKYGSSHKDTIFPESAHSPSSDFTSANFNLSGYANEYCKVDINFQALTAGKSIYAYVDDVVLGTLPIKELAATSIKGNAAIIKDIKGNYTVSIVNNGALAQSDYSVKLMLKGEEDSEIASLPGVSINPDESKDFQFEWIPATAGAAQVYGKVVLDGDEEPANNSTSALSVYVLTEPFDGNEDFESNTTNLPLGWTQEFINGTTNWVVAAPTSASTEDPKTVHGGTYKARFASTVKNVETILITPPMNLLAINSPVLKFWHTQKAWGSDQDTLSIYYKISANGEWKLIKKYTDNIQDWVQDSVNLPSPSGDYYIGFRGRSQYGYGIQLDDITLSFTEGPANDLAATSITGNNTPIVGQPNNYTVSVSNMGNNTQTDYSVKLMQVSLPEDIEIGSLAGISIAKGETKDFVFTYTPNTAGNVQLYGKVVSASDEESDNDLTEGYLVNVLANFSWNESFENNGTNLPTGWTQTRISGEGLPALLWKVLEKGTDNQNGNEKPATAQDGNYKARLFYFGLQNKGVKQMLSTPSINLTGVTPVLKFYHTQTNWSSDQDILRVYYKTSAAGEWTLLKEYTAAVTDWTKREISLPNPSADYYIGFEGQLYYGYGIQLDNISIEPAPTNPIIQSNASINFGNAHNNIPKPAIRNYIIRNIGGAPLEVTSVKSATDGISINGLPKTIAPDATDTITVLLDASGLSNGSFTGNFVLESNDPATPEFTVNVSASVSETSVSPYVYEPFIKQSIPEGWFFDPEPRPYGLFEWHTEGGVENSACLRGGFYGQTWAWTTAFIQTNYVRMGTNPELSFMYKLLEYLPGVIPGGPAGANTFSFHIVVSKYGSAVDDTVFSLKDGEHTPSADFTIIDPDVSKYANEYCSVKIYFKSLNNQSVFIYLDDITVGTPPLNQLAAVSIEGNTAPNAGVPEDYTVSVTNLGTATQSDYTVRLMLKGATDDEQIASTTGVNIAKDETKEFTLTWTPQNEGETQLYGELIFANDEFPEDNKTSLLPVNVLPSTSSGITLGTGSEEYSLPYDVFNGKSLSQTLYFPNEIGTNGGTIESLIYYSDFTGTLNNAEIQVWIGETDTQNLSNGWVPLSSLTEVFNGTVSVGTGIQNLVVPFDVPYEYRGGTLVVYSYKKSGTVNNNSFFLGTQMPFSARSRFHSATSSAQINPENPPLGLPGVGLIHGYPNTTFVMDMQGMGKLLGVVDVAGSPLEDAIIKIAGSPLERTTDANGNYEFSYLTPGEYEIEIGKHGYYPQTFDVTVTADGTVMQNATLVPIPTYTVSGKVNGSNAANGIENVEVTISGYDNYTATTNASGNYSIPGVYGGFEYSIKAKSIGYESYSSTLKVNSVDTTCNITLEEIPYPVVLLKAEQSGNNVVVNWQAPVTTQTFRYDNGIKTAEIGFVNQIDPNILYPKGVVGACYKDNTILYSMSWYLTNAVNSQPTKVNLFVFELNENGTPTTNIIYSVSDIPSTKMQWNTFEFPEPVEAPNGFFIAVSNSTQYLSLGMSNADENYPLVQNTHYYTPDYDRYAYYVTNTQHFMIRAEGAVLEQAAEPTAAYTPTPVGYTVYRLTEGQAEQSWTQLGSVTGTNYTDAAWATLPANVYQFAVKAEYANSNFSAAKLTDIIGKDMEFEYTVNITGNAEIPVTGAVVVLSNTNNNSNYVYTKTADSTGKVVFPKVWKGRYNLSIKKAGYNNYLQSNINIDAAGLSHNAQLIETIDAPYGLNVEIDGTDAAILSWNNFDNFTDDMESYDDFSFGDIIGPYKLLDIDRSATTPFSDIFFPYQGYTGSFIVFNPFSSQITGSWSPEGLERIRPASGEKFLACFAATSGGSNNDWLITPKIKIERGVKFKFKAKTYMQYNNLEKFQVGFSTTGTMPSDFKMDTTIYNAPLDWTEFSWDLDEYVGSNLYIAINCISFYEFIFMVDDIFIGIEDNKSLANKSFNGYTVYLDGTEVAESITQTEYRFTNLTKGNHTAGVQTVHSSGSSVVVNIDFTIGDAGIVINNKETFKVYPNPVMNLLNISTEAIIEEIIMIDQNGKVVKTQKGNSKSIDLQSLSTGHYVARIRTTNGVTPVKIVKK
jgi:hypothetical protein